MEIIPIAAFWCVIVWALFQKKHALLYVFFASLPFGSLAVVPIEWTAGLTITPAPIISMLVIVRQLCQVGEARKALDDALKPSIALMLLLFWIVAGVTTLFMPRFFAGNVQVINFSLPEIAILRPTLQNFSQVVYVSISVVSVFAFSGLLSVDSVRRHVFNAMCLGAALTVATGLLDFASRYLPLDGLLDLFRTANYALLVDDEILDAKRVVGLMPEASAFGNLALSFLALLYFFRRAMTAGFLRNWVVPVLMVLLVVLIGLSTSSAAYLGLGVLGMTAAVEWCWRLVASSRKTPLRNGLATEFCVSVLAAWLLLGLFVAMPRLFIPIQQLFDTMLLQKTSSSSYEERTMWTQVSWNALLTTHGIGVGLGGTRASNFAVTLASNTGALGAALYFVFVIQCVLIRRVPRRDEERIDLLSAMRWAYWPSFVVSLTIGTTSDFGPINAFLYGLSIAMAHKAVTSETRLLVTRARTAVSSQPRSAVSSRGIGHD